MLILASTSATRKALLAGAGLQFESSPAPIDERAEEAAVLGKGPAAIARHLAEVKALAVSRLHPDRIVIGADQILPLGEEILHKPMDLDAAREQLARLRGRTHRLSSGVALARNRGIVWSHIAEAELTMRDFTDGTSNTLLAVEAAPDKAEPWTKPGGLDFDPRNPLEALGTLPDRTFLSILADGSVQNIAKTIAADHLRRLIQFQDGEPIR